MSLFFTLRSIYNHPFNAGNKLRGLIRFVSWQIETRLLPGYRIKSFTEHTKLLMKKGLSGATGNLYNGLQDFEDMGFALHLLRKGDLFVDAGANIGAYSILVSGETGADSIAIEPIPSTCEVLNKNIALNKLGDRITVLNIGLAKEKGILKFTWSRDTVNHVAPPDRTDIMEVEVNSLNNVLPKTPALIKIDVEGYETEVIYGASRFLQDPVLKAIIVELMGSGGRYGFDEKLIHEHLLKAGFRPYSYDPWKRELTALAAPAPFNTIYIRDIGFVKERLINAPKTSIKNKQL